MHAIVKLQSHKPGELNEFLSEYYDTNLEIDKNLRWQKKYENPIEITDLIAAYIDNQENFDIKMWISLDKDIFIKISEYNANEIIKYLFILFCYHHHFPLQLPFLHPIQDLCLLALLAFLLHFYQKLFLL